MLDLNARFFMGAVTELRHMIAIIDMIDKKDSLIGQSDKDNLLLPHARRMIDALSSIGAKSALASAKRLIDSLEIPNGPITYSRAQYVLGDIESRFADHLDDIKLFVLSEDESKLMHGADSLLASEGFSVAFPNASFELEEGAKCWALGRHTASVFHAMRVLEIGLNAFSKFLKIPDPVKVTDRSWGKILESIEAVLDERWPKNRRTASSVGAELETLYVTLDAVKNPWRNTTMHVEKTYAPHDAIHILRCTGVFMMELRKHCNELGDRPDESVPENSNSGPLSAS
jgi:hypothetical protein